MTQIPKFRLQNNVIRNPEGKIKFKRFRDGGYDHYHIGLWLEAEHSEDKNQVERVEYELHPTFSRPIRESRNRRNDFSITFWSWGTFEVKAKIYLLGSDQPIEVTHELDYGLREDDDYIQVS